MLKYNYELGGNLEQWEKRNLSVAGGSFVLFSAFHSFQWLKFGPILGLLQQVVHLRLCSRHVLIELHIQILAFYLSALWLT